MVTSVVPTPPPVDSELAERISKLATYVARNGPEFEQKVREKEGSNPNFEFLRSEASEENNYYQWRLFCLANQYTDEQIMCMEDSHAHKLEWKVSGSVALLPADEQKLTSLLDKNNGSKDSIKATSNWILQRSHSIQNIGAIIRAYVVNVFGVRGAAAFSQLLHTAYVLNDLFYNAKNARSIGPYTKIVKTNVSVDIVAALAPNLPPIMHAVFNAASEDTQRDMVSRLIQLWTSKNFLSEAESIILLSVMSSKEPPPTLPAPSYTSPYLENPLPSNAAVEVGASQPDMQGGISVTNLNETQLAQLQMIQQRIQEQMQFQRNLQQHQASVQQLSGMSSSYPLPPDGVSHYPVHHVNPLFPGLISPPGMHFPVPYSQQHTFGGPGAPVNVGLPFLDLARIPVGNMANIIKAAKKAGHAPNTTIDVIMYASHATPHVEPGRVEIRVADFYRHAEALLNPEAAAASAVAAATTSHSESGMVRDRDDRNTSSRSHGSASSSTGSGAEAEEGWERYVPGYEEEKQRSGVQQDWDRPRPRKHARYAPVAEAVPISEIAEDNVGHKLLRGLGWQQGTGLGADGSGIVEPISANPGSDRSGVGLNNTGEVETLKDGSIDFSSYRKQLSSHYHSRINERG